MVEPPWEVKLAPKADFDLKSYSRGVQRVILRILTALRWDPRPYFSCEFETIGDDRYRFILGHVFLINYKIDNPPPIVVVFEIPSRGL